MKSLVHRLLIAGSILLFSLTAIAQAPDGINYQAVARDNLGNVLANQNLTITTSIYSGAGGTTLSYAETHTATTNDFGLFTLVIGEGTPTTGTFGALNWNSEGYYVEVTVNGNVLPKEKLQSVPYALSAKRASEMSLDDLTDVDPTGVTSGQVLKWNGSAWTPANDVGGGAGDNWGTQVVESDATLSGNGTVGDFLKIAQNGASNGQVLKWNGSAWDPSTDNNTDNQTLSLSGNDLTISGGNTVTLPSGAGDITAVTAGIGLTGGGTSGAVTLNAQTASALWNANKFQGRDVSASAPSSGEVLKWNGSAWAPATDATGGGGGSLWTQNGSDIYYTDPTGGVAIGRTTASTSLDVEDPGGHVARFTSGNNTGFISLNEGTSYRGYFGSYSGNAEDMDFGTGVGNSAGAVHLTLEGVPKLTLASNGRVGIGTTTPSASLEVSGSGSEVARFASPSGSAWISLYKDNDRKGILWAVGNDFKLRADETLGGLGFQTGGTNTDRMYIDDIGRVGIGTNSPEDNLHISSASNAILQLNNTAGGGQVGVDFIRDGPGYYDYRIRNDGGILYFQTDANEFSTTSTDAMSISNFGNVEFYQHVIAQDKILISKNSTTGDPHLDLYENENDYARINFRNTTASAYWAIAALNHATNGSEKFNIYNSTTGDILTVTGDGQVGIMNTNPTTLATLHVGNATDAQLNIGTAEYLRDDGANSLETNASIYTYIDNLNTLGTSSQRWNRVYSANGVTTTSDSRDKSNITDLTYGMQAVMALRPVSYQWADEPEMGARIGFLAQDLLQVLPEVVVDDDVIVDEETEQKTYVPATRLGVNYHEIIPVLAKGMQEQQGTIDLLQQKVEDLEAQVQLLLDQK